MGATFAVVLLLAGPASAVDPDGVGALRQCTACHRIAAPSGVIVPGGIIGPNLYGIAGRAAGGGEASSADLTAAGEAGLVFDGTTLPAFIRNPNALLSETLGRPARSRMPMGFPATAKAASDYLLRLGAP